MKKLITVALGLLMLSACAFTEDSIPVHYTAPANLELVQGASDVTLEVVGQDGRVANRDRISSWSARSRRGQKNSRRRPRQDGHVKTATSRSFRTAQRATKPCGPRRRRQP